MPPQDINRIRQQNIMNNYGGGEYNPEIGNYDYNPPTPEFNSEIGNYDYGTGGGALPQIAAQSAGQSPYDNVMSIYNKLYTPENQAMDAYTQLLNKYPQHERPSLGRTLVASGQAFGGNLKGSQETMDAPDKEALADWTAQVKPRYDAANLERQSNINERTLAYNAASSMAQQAKNEETTRANKAKEETARIRANAYDFKQRHQTWKTTAVPGGFLMAEDPDNPGHMEYATDDDGNKIPSGKLTDTDKANLQGKWNVAAANARGQNQINAINTRGGQVVYEDEQGPYTFDPKTHKITRIEGTAGKSTKVGGAGGAAHTGQQQLEADRALADKARRLTSTIPGAGGWFKWTDATHFTLLPESKAWTEASKAVRRQLVQELYGTNAQTGKYTTSSGAGGGRGGNPSIPPTNQGRGGGGGQVMKQYSASRNQTRISTDGGKTWQVVQGRQ